MTRLLIVSNRLPVSVSVNRGRIALSRSVGGLATGLGRLHAQGDSLWIGWPGTREPLAGELGEQLRRRLGSKRLVGVDLEPDEVDRFYERFANEVLWPTFHYLLDRVPIEGQDWELYERVNERFADAVVQHHRPGDVVWVHDYHLMRVPALLRRKIPDARIGFFLHIPFPPSDVFRTLPGRESLLEGLLGADLVGFHTFRYLRHFAAATLRTLGRAVAIDRIRSGDRDVRLGVYPMGIDAQQFEAHAEEPAVRAEVATLRGSGAQAILLGIDRLDYTKGIPRRLLAFERLLERWPELRERVRLIQIASPSRSTVRSYREFRNQVHTLIGRIHGAFATPSWVPVHYIHRGYQSAEITALYRAADVMLVTPLRDGMNLVAKEFVASRTDGDGVLVLSEFAGAADELFGALIVNPYDIEDAAQTFHRALTMSEGERRERMATLRARVRHYDVHRWQREFLADLEAVAPAGPAEPVACGTAAALEAELSRLRDARPLVLLLDYDGTLVPFAPQPELAQPDAELLSLLAALAGRAHTEVHVVSGRTRETLEDWLGSLAIHLHAEHGLASRERDAARWHAHVTPDLAWRARVRPILQRFADVTPGSLIEIKGAGLAWHWRNADPQFGAHQADELRLHLSELLASSPAAVLLGEKVLEVRPVGVSKAQIVPPLVERLGEGAGWLALGDDNTDEELFAALPADAVSVHVGEASSRARFRLDDPRAARSLLARLLAA
ncbi:MAG: bifunctional alpha,alpha-trehalose-phosphate synthase (UDP-forming)/trehalose-phosphatase [bacterium]